MQEPCQICLELWRAGLGEGIPCSVCDSPGEAEIEAEYQRLRLTLTPEARDRLDAIVDRYRKPAVSP